VRQESLRQSRVRGTSFLNLNTKLKWVKRFTPWSLYCRKASPQYSLNRWLSVQEPVWRLWRRQETLVNARNPTTIPRSPATNLNLQSHFTWICSNICRFFCFNFRFFNLSVFLDTAHILNIDALLQVSVLLSYELVHTINTFRIYSRITVYLQSTYVCFI